MVKSLISRAEFGLLSSMRHEIVANDARSKPAFPFVSVIGKKFGDGKAPSIIFFGQSPGQCELDVERDLMSTINHLYDHLQYHCTHTTKTPFWRYVRNILKISQKSSKDDDLSTDRVGWSNFYKIGQLNSHRKSNKLCYLQRDACKKIFEVEMSKLARLRRVKVVLAVGGAGEERADLAGEAILALFGSRSKWTYALDKHVARTQYEGVEIFWTNHPDPRQRPKGLLREECEYIASAIG